MYKVPDMFMLDPDREVLRMKFVTVVDLLRMVTQSAGVPPSPGFSFKAVGKSNGALVDGITK